MDVSFDYTGYGRKMRKFKYNMFYTFYPARRLFSEFLNN